MGDNVTPFGGRRLLIWGDPSPQMGDSVTPFGVGFHGDPLHFETMFARVVSPNGVTHPTPICSRRARQVQARATAPRRRRPSTRSGDRQITPARRGFVFLARGNGGWLCWEAIRPRDGRTFAEAMSCLKKSRGTWGQGPKDITAGGVADSTHPKGKEAVVTHLPGVPRPGETASAVDFQCPTRPRST